MKGANVSVTIDSLTLTTCKSITPPVPACDDIDVTNVSSAAKEYIPSIPDNGEFSFVIQYSEATFDSLKTLLFQVVECSVDYPDGMTGTCDGYIKSLETSEMNAESDVDLTVTVKVSGAWDVEAPSA